VEGFLKRNKPRLLPISVGARVADREHYTEDYLSRGILEFRLRENLAKNPQTYAHIPFNALLERLVVCGRVLTGRVDS